MIQGILLAAGSGSRFGGNKLLHPLADGTPLALAAARALRQALPQSLAVVRTADSELARQLRAAGLTVVVNPQAERGMGNSLACGVRATADAEAWVIALADMPFIQPATIRGVAWLLADGAWLAAPVYQGRRGHPVGFRQELREALTALDGDRGGQALLTRYAEQLCGWPVTDAGILLDVDTPADAVPIQMAGRLGPPTTR